MKIIKPGAEPEKWWTKSNVICEACLCVFRIEDDDYVSEDAIAYEPAKPPYVSAISVDCPTCGKEVHVMHSGRFA